VIVQLINLLKLDTVVLGLCIKIDGMPFGVEAVCDSAGQNKIRYFLRMPRFLLYMRMKNIYILAHRSAFAEHELLALTLWMFQHVAGFSCQPYRIHSEL
jgi:hypothetical protein